MVLKNNVGENFIYHCSNGTLEQHGAKLYLLLFKWYFRTTWGKTLFTGENVGESFIYRCSNGTLEQRGAKLYLPLFKWYLRTTWGKTLFTAVQMVL